MGCKCPGSKLKILSPPFLRQPIIKEADESELYVVSAFISFEASGKLF